MNTTIFHEIAEAPLMDKLLAMDSPASRAR